MTATMQQHLGQLLKVTWTCRRPPMMNLDDRSVCEPRLSTTEIELEIEVQPELLEGNPMIVLVAGERRFRVVEETRRQENSSLFARSDMDDIL
jgi:hypothetical protein